MQDSSDQTAVTETAVTGDAVEAPAETFYARPILNSPYEYPGRHWELDESNRPTNRIVDTRRPSAYVSPIPKPRKQQAQQLTLVTDETAKAVATDDQQYELTRFINGVRQAVDQWRRLPESGWRVTPETARLLRHWRHHAFADIRPFFCQVEAVETVIWLTEVAPKLGKEGREYLEHLADANSRATAEHATELNRLALKLATGAGKTTVMALLIAWQTVNAVRRPGSPRFTRGFLVVTPGMTIRQRLRVLQPNDPDSYYASRELVPGDMRRDLEKARIVITNYHALQRRETLDLSAGGRAHKLGALPVLKARMNADLHMADDLANTGKGNLFVIFGEPDIEILPAEGEDPETGRIQVKIHGVDVFHPSTGEVRSDGADGIACWFIDTDYNDESFFVRHAYFLGANDPYKALKTTLKAEVDADAWATLHSDTSRPFGRPDSGRIAVKVINHLGDEVMRVFQATSKRIA